MTLQRLCLLHALLLPACYDPEAPRTLAGLGDTDTDTDSNGSQGSSSTGSPDVPPDDPTGAGPDDDADPTTGGSTDTGPQPEACGDDIEGPSESCDDGNAIDGDGCDADCTFGGKTRWSVVVDGGVGEADFARDVLLTPESELIVVGGWSPVDDPDPRMLLARYDDFGQRLWNDDAGPVGIGYDVDLDGMGRIVSTGDADTGPLIRRFDATDAVEWTDEAVDGTRRGVATWESSRIVQVGATADGRWVVEVFDDGMLAWSDIPELPGQAQAVDIRADGSIIVVGYVDDPVSSQSRGQLLRYTADGVRGDEIEFDFGRDSALNAVLVLPSGGCLVAGRGDGNAQVRHLGQDGSTVWGDALDSGVGDDEAWDLALGPEGFIVVVGTGATGDPGDTDAFVARYSPQGEFQWWRAFSGDIAGPDAARSVVVSPQGRIFVAGQLRIADAAVDLWLAELSP